MTLSVTLAIPALNAARTLPRVLDGVQRQSLPPDEVLVLDDGSTDETAHVARHAGARLVQHERNRGLAVARNTCLEQARGEIVVFIDSDAVPLPDLITHLAGARRYGDPTLGAVGGQVIEGPTSPRLPDRWRSLFWVQTQGPCPLERAPFFIGACCSVRRSAALTVGGFSRDFLTNGEDVELSIRLRRQGFRIAYEPRAQVLHLRQDHLRSLLAMIYRHSRDHVRALRIHDEPWWPIVRSALRWGPVTTVSSLRRHRSAALAALSPLCISASLAGCSHSLLRRSR
jgi:O-antigen biosynthesis protein